MKKITLLITLFAFTFGFSQNGGDTCGAAVVIPTTAGTTNYTNTTINQTSGGGEMGSTQPRDAAWFSFTPTIDGTIDVSSCGNPGSDTRLYVGSGTCGALTPNLFDSDDTEDQCTGVNEDVTGLVVLAGNTYYVEWDDRWEATTSVPFNWSFTYTPIPCSPPNNISIDFKTQTLVDFRWEVPTIGVATSYDWEIVPTGAGQGNSVLDMGNVATTTASSASVLTQNTTYDIYVRANCGPDPSDYESFTFTTKENAPPNNDVCFNAEAISIEGNIATSGDATAVNSSILGACLTQDSNTCFGGGNTNDDVWYAFTAANGETFNITVETFTATAPQFDAGISLYLADCGNLGTPLVCEDSTFGAGEETATFTNSTGSAQNYVFRVYGQTEATPGNPNFTYKLWSSSTLSNTTFEANESAFKLFPNPVKEQLSVRAQNTIQNVTVYNMLGQEVLRATPNAISADINTSDLRTGTYFARVTVNNVTETVKILKR